MENEELILKKSINVLQISGKKQRAFVLIKTLLLAGKKKKEKPLDFLSFLIDEVSPVLSVVRTKSGNKMLDLPRVISLEQQYKIGIKWFLYPLRNKRGNSIINFKRLIVEFENKRGFAFTKRKMLYEAMISSRPFLFTLKFKQSN